MATPEEIPGFRMFERLSAVFRLSPDFVKSTLSESWASRVASFGEYVVLDEKLDRYTGDDPYVKKITSKPAGVGHWASQVAVRLQGASGRPFCFGVFPFLNSTLTEEHLDIGDVARWAATLVSRKRAMSSPVLVCDTYYACASSRAALHEIGLQYMMQFKASTFALLQGMIQPHLSHAGQSAVFTHRDTGEVACGYSDFKGGKVKKYYLTNAVVKARGREDAETFSIPTRYNSMFDVADNFNRCMYDLKDPVRPAGHERHFDSMAFRTMLVNAYNVHVAELKDGEELISMLSFVGTLGKMLLRNPTYDR
jgi:hypothetical protein